MECRRPFVAVLLAACAGCAAPVEVKFPSNYEISNIDADASEVELHEEAGDEPKYPKLVRDFFVDHLAEGLPDKGFPARFRIVATVKIETTSMAWKVLSFVPIASLVVLAADPSYTSCTSEVEVYTQSGDTLFGGKGKATLPLSAKHPDLECVANAVSDAFHQSHPLGVVRR